MRKIIALLITAALLVSAFAFTASAENIEWAVYASAGSYKETYENPDSQPKHPGLRFTDSGVQMYTQTSEQLKAMEMNAYCTIQSSNAVSYKNGLVMKFRIDEYYKGDADKWIAVSLSNTQMVAPGYTGYGEGWFCLFRPSKTGGTDAMIESYICSESIAMGGCGLFSTSHATYDGEEIVFEVRNDGGVYNIYINGINMNASDFNSYMQDQTAYVGITARQGVREAIALTITDFNGTKPTGNYSEEPFIPSKLQPELSYDETPEPEEGEPCWLWSADNVKDGKPGTGMTSTINPADGSLHITFDMNSPQISGGPGKNSYRTEEFPIFAIVFNKIDELCLENGVESILWYCADETRSPNDGSNLFVPWDTADYEDVDDWKIVTIDLSEEANWKGRFNSLRLDIASNGALAGNTADIMWIGMFRTAEDAYAYAGFEDLYNEYYKESNETESTDTSSVSEDAVTENVATDATDTKAAETGNTNVPGNNDNTGLIVGIAIGVVAVAVAAVVVVVIMKKKKK